MKSIKLFIAAGAIGLLGMAGLSSCKQNNSPVIDPESGDYNGETVKTEFVISIAENVLGADNTTKRMQGTEVQNEGTRAQFRGMDKIVLIPFELSFDERIGKNIQLSYIPTAAPTTAPEPGKLTSTKNAIYYTDVAMPLSTQRVLFYGKAIDETGHEDGSADAGVSISNDDTKKHKYGIVQANNLYGVSKNPDQISFDLVQIYNVDGIPTHAQDLADYASAIANAKWTDDKGTVDESDDAVYEWKSYTTGNGGNDQIKALYDVFIQMKAGSSFAVLAAVEDLYNTLELFQETQVTNDPLVNEIMAKILNGTDVDSGDSHKRTLKWETNWGAANYPGEIGVPEGAAYLSWDGEKFVPKTASDVTIGSGTGAYQFGSLTNFVYPASLQYFAESTIGTSHTSQAANYNDSKDWDAIYAGYTDGGTVKKSTKSVAIESPINYGVGQLKVVLKRVASTNWTDNDNNIFAYGSTDKLSWKGLLISGQKQVNYHFRQNESATARTIYDNYLEGRNSTTGLVEIPNNGDAVTNYTLVFSTKDNGTKDAPGSDKVYLVLEFKNTLGDFVGKDNYLIPKNGTFYLVGELDASVAANVDKTDAPDDCNIFYKDFVTTANVTLGADCLKKAYYTIPDLRSSELELGFSVDLVWQNGLIFTVEF